MELSGQDRVPTTAAALSECPHGNREGIEAVRAYEAKYGGVSERPITEWDPGFPGVDIDRAEFEEVWDRARAHLEANGA